MWLSKLLHHNPAKVYHKCSHVWPQSCCMIQVYHHHTTLQRVATKLLYHLDDAHTSVSHHLAVHITKCIIPRHGVLLLNNTPAWKTYSSLHALRSLCACMGAFNVGWECGVTPIIPPTMPPQQPLATPSLAKQPRDSTLIHTKTP